MAVVQDPNSENCSDLIFALWPCEKVVIVSNTNCITSAINPIRTEGGGCFPPGSRFLANNFGSNKSTQSKLSDVS